MEKRQISVLVPEYNIEVLDSLVNDGTFSSRLEAVKTAIYRLVIRELPVAHKFGEDIKHYIND